MNKSIKNELKQVLRASCLCKTYEEGENQVTVLDNVEFDIQRGERVAIIGSSGSGKSTLLNLLGGLDTPSAGEVEVVGQSLSKLNANERGRLRNRYLGFVYQFHHLLGEFTALENVLIPLMIAGTPNLSARKRAIGLLKRVGLGKRLNHKPSALSGGERQRVAIARAMVTHPDCVLMDEPTGNLDQETAESVQALMWQLNQDFGLSFVIVTHDQALAHSMDRVFELNQRKLTELG